MILKKWEELPEQLRTEAVRPEKKNARFLPRVCAFALCTVVKRYLINRY